MLSSTPLALLCLLLAITSAACRKSSPPTSDAKDAAAAKARAAAAPIPAPADGTFAPQHAAAAMGPFQADLDGTKPDGHLRALNNALTFWLASGRPFPKDVNELAAAKLITRVPAAPPGKKFVMDPARQQIVLAP
ncbi:MAG: hypothetical protein B9S33_07200 [Pedosphaera sp. Tous-C6FEB]|nr:MAG: hypothetical protein B9S33_07200 [Pedosphaera sp. Tous-C6FEB]